MRPEGHLRPAETMVECREDEQGEEAYEQDGRDDLLQHGLLGSRAGLVAPLHKRRVCDGEVDPEEADRDHKDHSKDPSLPDLDPFEWFSVILRAKLKQTAPAPDVVVDQIPPVRRIGV